MLKFKFVIALIRASVGFVTHRQFSKAKRRGAALCEAGPTLFDAALFDRL
jgi:hypothetical protein